MHEKKVKTVDRDNYEMICEMPQLAHEMGISKRELKKICKELKKDDIAHLRLEKDIEENLIANNKKNKP